MNLSLIHSYVVRKKDTVKLHVYLFHRKKRKFLKVDRGIRGGLGSQTGRGKNIKAALLTSLQGSHFKQNSQFTRPPFEKIWKF